MADLKYEIITDVEKAKEAWNLLSKHETIDDEWDFRYAFFKPLGYDLHFVVAYEDDLPIALLPLQKNNLEGLMPPYYLKDGKPFLEFFGGDDTDDNDILSKSDRHDLFRDLVFQIKDRAYLAPLSPKFETFPNAVWCENKYFVDLTKYKSYEEFLGDTWSSGSRSKILQQVRKINREHSVEVIYNNKEDIDLLSEYNIQRFGERSSFSYPYR